MSTTIDFELASKIKNPWKQNSDSPYAHQEKNREKCPAYCTFNADRVHGTEYASEKGFCHWESSELRLDECQGTHVIIHVPVEHDCDDEKHVDQDHFECSEKGCQKYDTNDYEMDGSDE